MRSLSTPRNRKLLVPVLLLSLALAACTTVPPQPPASPLPAAATTEAPPASPAAATATPLPVAPTETAGPATAPPAPPAAAPALSTDSLIQLVQASLPAGAFEGVTALPLTVPAGQPPLWAVYTYGMRSFDRDPPPDHFVAIYAQIAGKWQELARLALSADDQAAAAPDYVAAGSLTQVQIEPTHIWLALEGGAGAHSGVFDLLDFDGQALHVQANGFSSNPAAGSIKDVDGDGVPDVILNASDYYVFCYACGVVDAGFQVFAWDQANGRMVEKPIAPMLMGQSGHPARDLTNQAVALAQAGLWKDAAAVIEQAKQAAANVQPPFTNETVDWDYGLIKLTAAALADGAANSGYPLLSQVLYGDYAAAVDLLRTYTPAQIFDAQSPLLVGTVAEQWVPELSTAITKKTDAALALKPDLAPAYFLRGWASYLADPVADRALAGADVKKAAALVPTDTLYRDAAAFLAGSAN